MDTENKLYRNINTNYLVASICIMALVLLIASSFLEKVVYERRDILGNEERYRKLVNELVKTSDYLTYSATNYVVTGDKLQYDRYMNEMYIDKNREKTVDELIALDVASPVELELMIGILYRSNELAVIEAEAFDYMANGDSDTAQALIFSNEYKEKKQIIYKNHEILREKLESKIRNENEFIAQLIKSVFIITIVVSLSIFIASALILRNFIALQKEVDIDKLTGLYNRNKYKEKINKLILDEPKKHGALLFCDIDNLKFVNECYGHRNGDLYIKAMADSLRTFEEYPSVLSRLAGDEFVVYIHGFETAEDAKHTVEQKISEVLDTYFTTTLHVEEKIRFTSGAAVYPTDSNNIDILEKFADYAMLKMKKTSKGDISFYDKKAFDRSTFLLANKGHLDEFLEKELIDFAMQPIVDARTFEIYGYEALMRPQMKVINSPLLLLQLAKDESKLDKLERLVLKKAFEKINKNIEQLRNKKIFINSIADRILTKEELAKYIENYPNILSNVIIEVTEQEYVDEEVLKDKTEMFKEFGALIALDDYGAGYSNEFTLLSGLYDIVKIDMKIIRDIDKDVKRQEIVKSIIKVSKINNYKVLAEGVETKDEVEILQVLGVDFMQGFFFAKPDLEIKGISKSALKMLKVKNK